MPGCVKWAMLADRQAWVPAVLRPRNLSGHLCFHTVQVEDNFAE